MKLLLLLLVLACQTSIECYMVENRNPAAIYYQDLIEFIEINLKTGREYTRCILQESLSINCSEYSNDEKIRKSFPFYVEADPKTRRPSLTYALTNANKNIYYLNIVDQKCFPHIIFCLQHLEELYVQSTSFVMFNHQLPSTIAFLGGSLINLDISDTTVTHLSDQIGELTKLKVLKLSNTGLQSLPDAIGGLSSLTALYLPNNNLKSLPRSINNLRLLQNITLSKNPYLYSVEPLNGLPALRTLDTSHCSIKVLPRNLPQLTDLYMSNNNLTNLIRIETLGNETNNEKSFYFNRNYIRTVSPRIRQVKNLVKLNLNDNELIALPSDIFAITTLRHLSIDNNCLDNDLLNYIYFKFKFLFKSKPKNSDKKI